MRQRVADVSQFTGRLTGRGSRRRRDLTRLTQRSRSDAALPAAADEGRLVPGPDKESWTDPRHRAESRRSRCADSRRHPRDRSSRGSCTNVHRRRRLGRLGHAHLSVTARGSVQTAGERSVLLRRRRRLDVLLRDLERGEIAFGRRRLWHRRWRGKRNRSASEQQAALLLFRASEHWREGFWRVSHHGTRSTVQVGRTGASLHRNVDDGSHAAVAERLAAGPPKVHQRVTNALYRSSRRHQHEITPSREKATGRLTVRALEESFAEFGVPQVLPLPGKLLG